MRWVLLLLFLPALVQGESLSSLERYLHCAERGTCQSLRRHISSDSRACLVSPENVFWNIPPARGEELHVQGQIRYSGVVLAPYRYHVTRGADDYPLIYVRVKLQNENEFSAAELMALRRRFVSAANIWSDAFPFWLHDRRTERRVRFDLRLVQGDEAADFTVHMERSRVPGPYFRRASLAWKADVWAHEFGHMLGLNDEYDYDLLLRSTARNCLRSSIMCVPDGSSPTLEHYYLVLRRLGCEE